MTEETNDVKVKSWNECIAPRLEALRAWFSGMEWNEGMAPYLRKRFETFLDQKLAGNSPLTHEQERFIDGQLAMLREILAFPTVIRNNIAAIETRKKQDEQREKSVGTAGY